MIEHDGLMKFELFERGRDRLQVSENGFITDTHALENVYFKTLGECQKNSDEVSESSRFLINLSNFLSSHETRINADSSLLVFSEPLLICDFSIDQDSRKFSSQLIDYKNLREDFKNNPDEEKKQLKKFNELFQDLYAFDHNQSLSDQLVNDHFALDIRGEVLREIQRPENGENAALNKFLSILAFHLFQAFKGQHGDLEYFGKFPVNSFARTSLINLQELMEKGLGNNSYQGNSSLDVYPYFGFKSDDGEHLICISVSYLDPVFVDDKVEEEHRLPKITFAVFDISSQKLYRAAEDMPEWTTSYLRHLLCSLTHTVIAEKRREAIETAAGEAAEISRYWNSQGLLKLMKEDEGAGAFLSEDRFDFWERFVRELLCAKIPGVKTVETFPFDRAILIGETGDQKKDGVLNLRIQVLESSLRCKSSEYLNDFFTSRERTNNNEVSLNNFDLTDKKIDRKYEVSVSNEKSNKIIFDDDTGNPVEISCSNGEAKNEGEKVNQQLCALLGVLEPSKESGDDRDQILKERKKWRTQIGQYFNVEGISYTYCHGINLKNDISNLFMLNEYLGVIDEDYSRKKNESNEEFEGMQEDSYSTNARAKVVYVSFEPQRHTRNKELGMPLGDDERITLILIADEDPAKSAQDVDAERKDLELLITTVLRQKFRDVERKISVFSRQSEVIRSSLGQFAHNLKDASKEVRAAVKQQVNAIESMLNALEGKKLEPKLFTESQEILKTFSEGILVDGVNVSLEEYASSIVEKIPNLANDRTPKISTLLSTIPQCELSLPKGVVDEVFRVMFKNAVEAAAASNVDNPDVSIQISIRPDTLQNNHSLEVLIENSSKPVQKSVLDVLNNSEPQAFENYKNPEKEESTGVGVYIARVMLQYGVGQGADLNFFMMSPTRFQTRMTIPCYIIPIEYGEIFEERADTNNLGHHSTYILYVEDEDCYGLPSSKFLADSLSGWDCRVQWERALEESVAAVEEKLPELLIADMNFWRSNKEKSTVSDKHGRKLLAAFFSQLENSDKRPPVWIVSNEARGDLINKLKAMPEYEKSAYLIEDDSNGSLLDAGTVYILSNIKTISDSDLVQQAIKEFSICVGANNEVEEATRAVKTQISEIVENATAYQETILSKNFGSLDKDLNHYAEENDAEYRNSHTFVVHAKVASLDGLSRVIKLWHKSLGIPDPEFDEDGSVPLTSSDHKKIFLRVGTNLETMARLRPKFKFWCFQNNIILTLPDVDANRLVSSWDQIHRTDIFAALRHDLRGMRGVDEAYRDDLIKQVTACESRFKLTDAESDLVNTFMNGDLNLGSCESFVINKDGSNDLDSVSKEMAFLVESTIEYGKTLREEGQKLEIKLFSQMLSESHMIVCGGDGND